MAELTAQGEALKGEIAQAQAGAQAQRQALAALQREMAALAAAPGAGIQLEGFWEIHTAHHCRHGHGLFAL